MRANGLDLWCETFGDAGDPAVLLVMGIGTSGIAWDDELCRTCAAAGYYVIRFDNRDTGLSSTVDYEAHPYTLTDMAHDAVALLDALGIDKAHVVGASLGGMIAQELAIEHPDRLLTLTSIISTPSIIDATAQFTADLPPMREELLTAMMELAMTPVATREERIEASLRLAQAFVGSRYRPSDDEVRAAKARELDRLAAHFGEGSAQVQAAIVHGESSPNQGAAVARSRDRIPLLPQVTAPTLVVSGDEDPFFAPEHGRLTAELVPGARFVLVKGLGHTPPPPAELAPLLLEHFRRAG